MINFLGIGAQKAGTTWLFENLKKHNEIAFPQGKEIHFWNNREKMSDDNVSDYLSIFSGEESFKKGEITPAYAILEPEVIEEIYSINNTLRIFIVLRNPIERAWSSALMALKRAEMEFDEASDQWFIDHFNSSGSLRRGNYSECLRNWIGIFGREQVLIEWFDNIQKGPVEVLKRCSKHIGVDSSFYDTIPEEEFRSRIFKGAGYPLRQALLTELRRLYYPQIKQLEHDTKVTLQHWYI